MTNYYNFGNVGTFVNKSNIKNVKINVSDADKVTLSNDKLYVDGKLYVDKNLKNKEVVSIIIEGNVQTVESMRDVIVHGDVVGGVRAMRDVEIKGSVAGNVDAGRDVEIGKNVINGKINAGRDIEVYGKIDVK